MAEISVVVPVYNCEKYLSTCLDSLIQQSFQELEIICIDDGSTDQSYKILCEYAERDNRLKVYQQKNQGVAVARNVAINYATGTWLAFCDSDDTVPMDAYRQLYKATKNVDVVVGEFYDVTDNGNRIYSPCRGKYEKDYFYAIFKVPCIWTKLIRRTFLIEHEVVFPRIPLGEDVIFLAELSAKKPNVRVIHKAVYDHWYHDADQNGSLNHQYTLERFQQHIHCREKLHQICYEKANIQQAHYYVYHEMMGFLLDFLYRMSDTEERKKAFRILKEFMQKYEWMKEEKRFYCLMGVPYAKFLELDAEQYFMKTNVVNHADIVLQQYQAGALGFRYILKYIIAWAEYKWKRAKLEHKK